MTVPTRRMEREPILWTERTYPCGCHAKGAGDIPPYCGTHGIFHARKTVIPADPRPCTHTELSEAYDALRSLIYGGDIPVTHNLSHWEYDDLVRDAMKWRSSSKDKRVANLLAAVKPFANVVLTSKGPIPTERLSMADWHTLCKEFGTWL